MTDTPTLQDAAILYLLDAPRDAQGSLMDPAKASQDVKRILAADEGKAQAASTSKGSSLGRSLHHSWATLKASFFETCERDEAGHCIAGTGGGNSEGESEQPDKEKAAKKEKVKVAPKPKMPKKAKAPAKLEETPAPPLPDKPKSEKALRAQSSAVRVDKTIQRYAEEYNEPRFAKAIGGMSYPDSEPVDVSTDTAAIELKTLVKNGNGKLTMDKYAQVRKIVYEQEQAKTFHTCVSDDQKVFDANGEGQHDDSKRGYYYRRGVAGSARIASMYKCKDEEELKHLMSLPEDELPDAAKRTDAKLRVGAWEFVQEEGKKTGYYRNSETGDEAHPKK